MIKKKLCSVFIVLLSVFFIYEKTHAQSLEEISPLGRRIFSSGGVIDGKFLVWGGYGADPGNHLEGAYYDFETSKWIKLPESPFFEKEEGKRDESASGITNGKFFVWGGDRVLNSKRGGAIFDMTTQTWSVMPESPLGARTAAAGAATNGKFIVWGGSGLFNGYGWSQTRIDYRDGAVFDSRTGLWSLLPEPPKEIRSRNHAAVAATDNKFIIWGGKQPVNVASGGALYDLKTKKWSLIPNPPKEFKTRTMAVAAAIDGKFIVWGGISSDYLDDGAIYDIGTKTWTIMPKSKLSVNSRHLAGIYKGKFVMWGGRWNDFASFNLKTNKWEY